MRNTCENAVSYKEPHMTTRLLAATALVVLSVSSAAAQQPQPPSAPPAAAQAPAPPPQYPIVRVGALSYLQYDAELENRDGFNNFDVTRAYLNINAQISDNIRFRFTPDIRRVTDSSLSGSLVVRVKYAFAQFDNITPRAWIRLGLHQTPWLDFEESINRYRVQGTMFSEREGLIPGSADFGVSYFTPLPNGYGEVQGGVFNGEGFTQPEANKYKSVQGRLTVRPFPNASVVKGLRVSAFYNAGWYAADRPRRLGIVMGSFEHDHLVATVEGLRATENPLTLTVPRDIDRNGWSVFVEPRQGPAGLAGIFRYDAFVPDDSLVDNDQDRFIAGGAYWFVWPRAKVGFVVTNEQVKYESPTRLDENRILVQTHIEF
jgi:opacity protein-like surface antigen